MNTRLPEYNDFLELFAGNNQLIELIKWCFLDEEEQREEFYRKYKHYPEKRDLLWKLKRDLVQVKNEIGG